jgi:anti-anti-sigma factor
MWDVSFIDASGFRVLIAAHCRLERDGRKLVLAGVPPAGLKAMKVLGLDKVLDLDGGM